MYNDDYVILIDENGQPYIEHSVFSKARDAVKSAGRSAHKYIAKVGEGAKARYFYTQEELRAFYNQGKAAVGKAAARAGKAISDASGLTARRQVQATARVAGASSNSPGTRKAAGRAYANAVAKYAKTPLGRIETFMQDPLGNTKRGAERVGAAARSGAEAVRSGVSKAASAVRSGASKAAGAVRGAAERVGDWAGLDERRAVNDALSKYSRRQAADAYSRTPLGRIESAVDNIEETIDRVAGKVRSGAVSAHEAAQQAAKSAWDAAKRAAGRAGEAISSGASKVASAAKIAGDAAKKAPTLAKARADYQLAVREYEKALERGGDGYAEYYAMLEAAGLVQQLGGTFK